MQKLRVGIIGAGRIGQVHAKSITYHIPQAEIVAISDLFPENAQKVADDLGIPKAVQDYHEILNDPTVDAVLICSSTDTHADIAVEAAKAGKHIFCEKPVDLTVAKIKAVLPEKESVGVLQIFAGPKGLQKHFDNIHELAIVIPLSHEGTSKPTKFVQRFPTVQSQKNDLYIIKPQTSKIVANNMYNFEIEQYPSKGLNSGSGLMNQDFKLVIESPSGKYFKLNKEDNSKPYGLYSLNIKCQELGLYRGLVIGDSGTSWYVFAQWECIGSTVAN